MPVACNMLGCKNNSNPEPPNTSIPKCTKGHIVLSAYPLFLKYKGGSLRCMDYEEKDVKS